MPHSPLPDIKSLDRTGLERALADLGQPLYRARQLERWLYAKGAASFEEMTDLPTSLRTGLAGAFALSVPRCVERQLSSDGTRKYLLEMADGVAIECVGIPEDRRLTVCFSTQAGCAMGCSFCASGHGGFVRDLSCGEMVDQVATAGRDFERRVANAVAMGQGEPFANYGATLAALRFMNSPDGLGIGARRLTVSTCGLPAGIARLAEEPEQFTLAVSLHSAVPATRDRLMPGVRGVSIDALRDSLADYAARTGRRPTLEYALLDGVNDTREEVEALVAFCEGLGAHVNLIPANPSVPGANRSPTARVHEFAHALASAGVEASVRRERGADIDAACGQLTQRQAD